MNKLIIFKASWQEIEKYRKLDRSKIGDSFYRVANSGSVPSLTNTIAEYYDSSGKPSPEVGYRLTETVPDDRDRFRDSGWEVMRVEEYTPEMPAPYGADFDTICLCYCAYQPLAPEEDWTKQSHRLTPSLESFGGDERAYREWLATQPEEVRKASVAAIE